MCVYVCTLTAEVVTALLPEIDGMEAHRLLMRVKSLPESTKADNQSVSLKFLATSAANLI